MNREIEGLGITKRQFVSNLNKSTKECLKQMMKDKENHQDFLSVAQMFYKAYLLVELDTGYNTKTYERLLRRGRKGLGYSYP